MTSDSNPLLYVIGGNESAVLNRLELTSVHALVAYVAQNQNVGEAIVQEMVQTHFDVQDVTQLPQKSYDEVIAFLVDMKIDLMVN